MAEKEKTMARMEACKIGSSERHNNREKDLDYVRKDLSNQNEKEIIHSISSRMKYIRDLYLNTFGQKMQASAEPIQEIVLRIGQDTTLEQVKKFGELCQQEYGLTPLQYYVHKDEGHYDAMSGDWIPNLHAHIVVDVTCYEHKMVRSQKKSHGKAKKDATGKPIYTTKDAFCTTIKFKRSDMSRMQDFAAEATGMQRGTPSTAEHLDAIQYKAKCAAEDLRHAEQKKDQVDYEAAQREFEMKYYEQQIKDLSLTLSKKGQLTADAFREKITRILGKSQVEKRNEELVEENNQIKEQMNQVVQGFEQIQKQLAASEQLLATRYDSDAKQNVFEEIIKILIKYAEWLCEAFRRTKEPDLHRLANIIERGYNYIEQQKGQMAKSDIERIATQERSKEIGNQKAEQATGVMKSYLRHAGAPEEAEAEARQQIKIAEQTAQKWVGRKR